LRLGNALLSAALATSRAAMSSWTHLGQASAVRIDEQLFAEYGFSVEQLMELAGLACAQAVHRAYPPASELDGSTSRPRVLICCGPGNNGGDGLVCARHLGQFGYSPSVYYPKRTDKPLYRNLLKQCIGSGIPIVESHPTAATMAADYDIVVDALFGFSFKPPVRPEFEAVMSALSGASVPVVSIDVPSGWDVELGPVLETQSIQPDCLVSLTAPKMCAKHFTGRHHFLGGRFVPPELARSFSLNLPCYPGCEQIVSLNN
ncbi:hypothetical protein BOX15_Mlig028091g2, partial [Macrostomum lignano]